MANDTQQTTVTDHKAVAFGTILKSTRETLGIERKDAAAQLCLSDDLIGMMESGNYPTNLPNTFMRGYLRAYGKLLLVPDNDIETAIEPLNQKTFVEETPNIASKPKPMTINNYVMQLLTGGIALTLLALVGIWWYSHSSTPTTTIIEPQQGLSLSSAPVSTEAAPTVTTNQVDATTTTEAPTAPQPQVSAETQTTEPATSADEEDTDTSVSDTAQ